MNAIKVELPDGTLLTLEGGDAESTARYLMNHYLRPAQPQWKAGPPVIINNEEEPLPLPVLTFGKAEAEKGGVPASMVMNSDDEEPLPLPTLKFR